MLTNCLGFFFFSFLVDATKTSNQKISEGFFAAFFNFFTVEMNQK